MSSSEINIAQEILITKLMKFFKLVHDQRKDGFVAPLQNLEGHCSAFTSLALLGMELAEEPHRLDEHGKPHPRDDWQWLEQTYIKISLWNEDLNSLSAEDTADIERLYSHLEYFQNPFKYNPISQGDLHLLAHYDDPKKIELKYSLAGLFTANDFTKPIHIDDRSTTLFHELFKEDTDVILGSHNHAMGLRIRNDRYYFYDSNHQKHWRSYEPHQKNQLIDDIFTASITYLPDQPSPFEFRVFTINKSVHASYTEQATLLAAVNSAFVPLLSDYADNTTALHMAADIGCEKSLAYYIEKKSDLNLVTSDGSTPLYKAAHNGRINAVRLLLAAGAAINGDERKGTTPLFIAAQFGYRKIVSLLADAGADLYKKNNWGLGISPLSIAADREHIKTVKLLIEKLKESSSFNPSIFQNSIKETLAHTILKNSSIQLIELLLDQCDESIDDIIFTRFDKVTLLQFAIQVANLKLINYFISRGANVNYSLTNETPLHAAILRGELALVDVLVKNGALINARNPNNPTSGQPPIAYAIYRENLEIIKLLVNNGADIESNFINYYGNVTTPLNLAAQRAMIPALVIMFEKNNNLNMTHLLSVLTTLHSAAGIDVCHDFLGNLSTSCLHNLYIKDQVLQMDCLDDYASSKDCENVLSKMLLISAIKAWCHHELKNRQGSVSFFLRKDLPSIAAALDLIGVIQEQLDINEFRQLHAEELKNEPLATLFKHVEQINRYDSEGPVADSHIRP
ncbi:ankyrin repeat domain-containing protein [Legionella worsleiensis]|uniref:Ankyrin repeat-containing protein n=2 Tax=Legionella worsleiensis TaxID=45076 RepID=A0A0W1AEP8_9GAMM|nr:ankyrin repeat-containing protein [Legionella worsleiensis]STY32342.1 ankyrin repeat-containing protein [Legionella worsleiensis]